MATFAVVAVLPAATLTGWFAMQALNREKESTGAIQHHLAEVVALGLDRYAQDVRSAFEHMASLDPKVLDHRTIFRFARNLRFRYLALIDENRAIAEFTDFEHGNTERLTPAVVSYILEHSTNSPQFLPVFHDGSDEPTIFISEAYQDGTALVAAVSNSHIRETQKSVAAGEQWHAVIVDQNGQVIAHPNPEWEQSAKSVASMQPVMYLLQGETGYNEFFAAGMEKSAMAGYARSVAGGWGVVIVRPMDEIVAVAWEYALGSITFVVVGLLAALVLAYVMARVIVRPVERVARVAQRLGGGDLVARVDPLPEAPSELRDLSQTINSLARNLNLWQSNLTESLEEAQASDQAKTNFLASLSHEIRTPLNAIVGFAETLRDNCLGTNTQSKQREYAADIVAAGQHLTVLIDGILELSTGGQDRARLSTGPVEPKDAACSVLELLKAQAERQKIGLVGEFTQSAPPIVADEAKLKQSLIYLVSNGIKFTPEGGTVTVSAFANTNGTVSLTVTDNGIGMSPRDLDIALTPFGRIDKAWTRGRTGTGLGLPLARQLVEAMGGVFAIDSIPGYGTTVTLTFPPSTLAQAA